MMSLGQASGPTRFTTPSVWRVSLEGRPPLPPTPAAGPLHHLRNPRRCRALRIVSRQQLPPNASPTQPTRRRKVQRGAGRGVTGYRRRCRGVLGGADDLAEAGLDAAAKILRGDGRLSTGRL